MRKKMNRPEEDELYLELEELPDEADLSTTTSRSTSKRTSRKERKAEKAEEKKRIKEERKRNSQLMLVTYLSVVLFLGMIGYMIHFNVVRSKEIISSPYNIRQDLMADRVRRGDIVDSMGNVLATSEVDDDGNEYRVYPYGEIFAQVVGYSVKGKTGIEAIRNFDLLDSNAFITERVIRELEGQKNIGDTVVTSLNADLQETAYRALGDNRGAVVAIEPSTGRILAMVSKPSFDPNYVDENWEALNSDPESALLNRATLGKYTPGSTFKLFTALEYLRESADPDSYGFTCNGEYERDNTVIHCYGNEAHGAQSLADSMANSCNASFSNIGLSLDIPSWRKTMKDLLFDQSLDCDLTYNQSTFALQQGASTADIMMTSIGQGETLVTPYHMAMIVSAIANGGVLMKPYLVDAITNYKGASVKKYIPQKSATLMTPSEAAKLTDYMCAVVDYGTATSLSGLGYSVAGKTGTAEVSMDKQVVNSWFVGFSSVENPDLVVCVVIEDADTASITGTYVAKQIFDAYH